MVLFGLTGAEFCCCFSGWVAQEKGQKKHSVLDLQAAPLKLPQDFQKLLFQLPDPRSNLWFHTQPRHSNSIYLGGTLRLGCSQSDISSH